MSSSLLRRREFMTLFGGAAAWPGAAWAQQQPVIGFLHQGSAKSNEFLAAAFRSGLNDAGYFEGRNVAIEYRWAEDRYDRLPQLAADLVRHNVAVIAAAFGLAVRAAKSAASSMPIVFVIGEDPVESGLVSSFNRPSGNTTGIAFLNVLLGAKRLGLLREVVPAATTFALLLNPTGVRNVLERCVNRCADPGSPSRRTACQHRARD
jgi:putative ABC transport system substrate-binding protein